MCRKIDAGDSFAVLVNTSGSYLLPYYTDSSNTGLSYYDADAQSGSTSDAPLKFPGFLETRPSLRVTEPDQHADLLQQALKILHHQPQE